MFEHSIKVPRLYKTAAKIVKKVNDTGTAIKHLVYECRHTNIKAVYALVAETVKRKNEINFILNKSKLFTKETRVDEWLARVLITELLWGKTKLPGESLPVKTILAYEQIFKAHVNDFDRSKADSYTKVLVQRPRYIRVNNLKISTNEAIDAFRDEDWILVKYTDKTDYKGFLQKVANLEPEEFMVDIHVKDLLIFPPKTEFFKHEAYLSGSIVLQEKASCLPVTVLNPPPGSIVLDMCAAPGNKTTQLADLMNNDGKVYAVDMDEKRLLVLQKLVHKSGATCVKIINRDVLTITKQECPNVEYILVDPSCTGSGIVDRDEFGKNNNKVDPVRLQKLSGFQIKILKHALKNFPNVKRVVYSTCSLLPQENEEVVKEVLQNCRNFKLVPIKNELPAPWLHFGSSDYGEIGNFTLYSKPDVDLSIGFFIAVFERLKEDEVNPYYRPWIENKEDFSDTTNNKKKRKRKDTGSEEVENNKCLNEVPPNSEIDVEPVQKHKKKKKKSHTDVDEKAVESTHDNVDESGENSKFKKKKAKKNKDKTEDTKMESNNNSVREDTNNTDTNHLTKKRKKKNKLEMIQDPQNELLQDDSSKLEIVNNGMKEKKKKKKRDKEKDDDSGLKSSENMIDTDVKKKKKKRTDENVKEEKIKIKKTEEIEETGAKNESEIKKKKKKSKHSNDV